MTLVDVDWLESLAEFAGAKVEVDRDGGVVVSPAADPHVLTASRLIRQLSGQIPDRFALTVEGPRWAPLGEPGPSYVPDLAIIVPRALDRDDYGLVVPPLLVVEILSPSTRRRDLGEKADGYHRGGAEAYWTIEVPGLADVERPVLQARTRGPGGWEAQVHAGRVVLGAGELTGLHVDIDALV